MAARQLIDYLTKSKEISTRLNLRRLYQDSEWLEHQVNKGRLHQKFIGLIPKIAKAAEIAFPGMWDIQFNYEVYYESYRNMYSAVTFDHDHFENYINRYGYDRMLESNSDDISRCYMELERGAEGRTRVLRTHKYKYHFPFLSLVIHFPEVTITNKKDHSHLIKDLFIKLDFNLDGTTNTIIKGNRSTYSRKELLANYTHSHLPASKMSNDCKYNRLEWQNFCKGNGPLAMAITTYNVDQSEGNLLSILHGLKRVVAYESIDGGPHIHMSHIVSYSDEIPDSSRHVSSYYRTLLRLIKEYFRRKELLLTDAISLKELDWTHNKGNYSIIDNEKFNDFCVYYLADQELDSPKDSGKVIVYKRPDGSYFRKVDSFRAENYIPTDKHIPFQGRKIFFEVLTTDSVTQVTNKKYIHPQIREYVKKQLESSASKAAIRQTAINRLNQD